MKFIKSYSILLLCIMSVSCAQKIPICKRNDALTLNNSNTELAFSLAYLPRNILVSTPNPSIEKIDYNTQFESYLYAKLKQLKINKSDVTIKDSSFENFEIKINKISPYQVCDLSNLQIDLQQRLNTKYQSFFTINKNDENIINSDTLIVPYNPMTLRFINLNHKLEANGIEAVLVNYLYFNENNDKVYQKVRGFIDETNVEFDIPYQESSTVRLDNNITINIRNIKYNNNSSNIVTANK